MIRVFPREDTSRSSSSRGGRSGLHPVIVELRCIPTSLLRTNKSFREPVERAGSRLPARSRRQLNGIIRLIATAFRLFLLICIQQEHSKKEHSSLARSMELEHSSLARSMEQEHSSLARSKVQEHSSLARSNLNRNHHSFDEVSA